MCPRDDGDGRGGVETDSAEAPRSHTTVLRLPREVECHVVGVCHLSQVSAAEARSTVEAVRPNAVCLELCEERTGLLYDSGAGVLPPLGLDTLKEHWWTLLDPVFWVVHLQLMALEALLGAKLGAEQAAAAAAAHSVGSAVFLADRRQSVTVMRTIAALASLAALRDVVRGLRSSSAALPELASDVAELEWMLLSADLSDSDFSRAAVLARRMVDTLLNSPHVGSFGRGGEPIQEERDYLLSHALYHSCCAVPPGGRVVAVLGAAHVPGVVKHFGSFRDLGTEGHRAVENEVAALNEVHWAPIYGVLGTLLAASCTGLAGRYALVRHLRRTRGARTARNFNLASGAVAAGLGAFGLYRAQHQYGAVRRLQLRRCRAEGVCS